MFFAELRPLPSSGPERTSSLARRSVLQRRCKAIIAALPARRTVFLYLDNTLERKIEPIQTFEKPVTKVISVEWRLCR